MAVTITSFRSLGKGSLSMSQRLFGCPFEFEALESGEKRRDPEGSLG
jgi:hypothetical protein